jgi:hypothetical protein
LHDVSEKPENPVEYPVVATANVDEQMIAKGPISFWVNLRGRLHRKPGPQIEVTLGTELTGDVPGNVEKKGAALLALSR